MGAPLRVLVLNERDPRHPQAGGAEIHVHEIFKRLAADGVQVTQLVSSFAGAVGTALARASTGSPPERARRTATGSPADSRSPKTWTKPPLGTDRIFIG